MYTIPQKRFARSLERYRLVRWPLPGFDPAEIGSILAPYVERRTPNMQPTQMRWLRSAALALTVLSLIGAMSTLLKADEMLIFGDIAGLSCQGAADKTFPGFAVITFTFGDKI